MKMKTQTIYAVKNVRSFQGREGLGFTCSLYRDGKRIGTVTDAANGGMIDFYLHDGEKEKLDKFCKDNFEPEIHKIPTEPPIWDQKYTGETENVPIAIDVDMFVSHLVDEFENQKKIKRLCKKNTLYHLITDKAGSYWSLQHPYTPIIKRYLQDEYGDKLVEIVNERFIQ